MSKTILFIIVTSIIINSISYNGASTEIVVNTNNKSMRENNVINEYLLDNIDLKLNRVYDNLFQDNWSGGSGQNNFSNPSKYCCDNNIITNSNGTLNLGIKGTQGLWEEQSSILPGRYGHTAVWNPDHGQMIIFGGIGPPVIPRIWYDELWIYNPITNLFTKKSTDPEGRYLHSAIWNSATKSMFIFGGEARTDSGPKYFNDLWEYKPATDQWLLKNIAPIYRYEHTSVYDSKNNQMIVFGGKNESDDYSNETWIYKFDSDLWQKKKSYINVTGHSAILDNERGIMITYGGGFHDKNSGRAIFYNNLSIYNINSNKWIDGKGMDIRYEYTFVWNEKIDSILLFGGRNNSYEDVLFLYNVSTEEWKLLESSPIPLARHSAVWDSNNNQMLIYGGNYFDNNNQILNDRIYSYKLDSPSYTKKGYMESSTIDLKQSSRLESITVDIESLSEECGNNPVQLQIGFQNNNDWEYFGPDGTSLTTFKVYNKQKIQLEIDNIEYVRYKLILSTINSGYSPLISKIDLNYSYFENNKEIIFDIIDTKTNEGKPIKKIIYNSYEPFNTEINLYLCSSPDKFGTQWSEWEIFNSGQQSFSPPILRYYKLKAILKTIDNSITPELQSLRILFNIEPSIPVLIEPHNNSWVNTSLPKFEWIFFDNDSKDIQSGFKLQISSDYNFKNLIFDIDIIDYILHTYKIDKPLTESSYYWRIGVFDSYRSWSGWSKPSRFDIDITSPDAPLPFLSYHSNPVKWSNNNDIYIDWSEPYDNSQIAGFSFMLNEIPLYHPDHNIDLTIIDCRKRSKNDENIGKIEYQNIESGKWYFHIKSIDINGHWSDTSTLNIKIDKQKPDYYLDIIHNIYTGNELLFNISTYDNHSGIEKVTLFWKYSSEIYFNSYEEINNDNSNQLNMSHSIEVRINSLDEIIYFFKIEDRVGLITYTNDGSYEKIEVYDNNKPQFITILFNRTYTNNSLNNITVYSKDNIDVAKATIEFIDYDKKFNMKEIMNDVFIFEMDESFIETLTTNRSTSLLKFKIIINDNSGNINITPNNDYFYINLSNILKDKNSNSLFDDENNLKLLKNILLILSICISLLILFLYGHIKKYPIIISIEESMKSNFYSGKKQYDKNNIKNPNIKKKLDNLIIFLHLY